MTLSELRIKVEFVNLQGLSRLSNGKLEIYQSMAFDWLLALCEPLNLVIPYSDSNIYKRLDDGWFLRKPTIAKHDDDEIDLDERLELAFVYIIVSFLAVSNGGEKRFEASKLVLEYSISIDKMGYSKAKKIYEESSFITAVKFDCHGRFYEIEDGFVSKIIDCILCQSACMRADEYKQLEKYKKYLKGTVSALDREKLLALDTGVFNYLIENKELIVKYTEEELNSVTSRFEELCKFSNNEQVERDIEALDKRLSQKSFCIKGGYSEY
jgi:hypothetical protein